MSALKIELPDALTSYLQDQVSRRGYENASEFVKDLIEAEKHRQVKQEVEGLLLEAADGPFEDWTAEDMQDIRQSGERIIQRQRGQ